MKISEIKYERPDIAKIKSEYEKMISEFSDPAKTPEQLIAAYDKMNDINRDVSTMGALAYVRFTLNTEDDFYVKEMDFYDEVGPVFYDLGIRFAKAMLSSKHRAEIEKTLPSLIFKNYEILIKSFSPVITDDCVEENKLQTKYKKLLSSAKIPFKGETLNIPQLGKYMNGADRETRREAFDALGHFLKDNGEEFDAIYDRMIKVRDKMAKKMGYKSYVELGYYRMRRNCYSPEDIASFRDQVMKDWVPFVWKLKKEQAKKLDIDKMMLYDDAIYFKEGNPTPTGTPEEMFANGKRMYEEMSPATGEFIRFMLDHDLFDVISRKGKSAGGYCIDLPSFKMPFIFANFNGTSDDVDVLTHEAGHALAAYKAMNSDIPEELRQGGMDTCEVHSMSMEFFAWKWMELFFGKRADDYRYMHFLNAVSFIPYGTMVDYFQQRVYENPEMSPADRKMLWTELEGKFRPYLSCEGITYIEEGGRWQYQSHIFERPFYYIDYCLAQSTAFDFLIESKKNYKEAFENYDRFLCAGGSKTYADLVKTAGFRLPYEKDAIADIIRDLTAFV